MKFALLAIVIIALIVSLIWGVANLGGEVGKAMVWLGVLSIVVVAILGGLLYRGLKT